MNHPEDLKGTRCHLSQDERYELQHMLDSRHSVRSIAKHLGRSPSTILREINRHISVLPEKGSNCLNKKNCSKRNVCGNNLCKKACHNCIRCKRHCEDYVKAYCDILQEPPYLCNGCRKFHVCLFERRTYRASHADKEYRHMLVERRNGFDLTLGQLEHINTKVTPLIQQGLSPYHIKQTLGEDLPVSESTLRRLITGCELDVRNVDLREQVRRKPRTHHQRSMNRELIIKAKEGHLYSDYLAFLETHDVNVVQMDCVEGVKEDRAALLTLHFPAFCMQLAVLMEEHTSRAVVTALDTIEEALGAELFREIFEVLLTDNGHEFLDIKGMERSLYEGKRTTVFFCEANRSDEKGSCENNHRLIRYVIPKGTSLEQFTQQDISLMMNHINSYARKSLFGKTPYDIAKRVFPEDFFDMLGLYEIPPEQVLLKPALLKA